MLRRILIMVACLILVLSLTVCAFAVSLDPNDYIANVESDGTNDIVTYTIPASSFTHFSLELLNSSASSLKKVSDSSLSYSVGTSSSYWLVVSPFSGGDFLDVRDFPAVTTLTFDCTCTFNGAAYYGAEAQVRYQLRWYDKNGNLLLYEVTDFEYLKEGFFTQSVTLNKPDGAVALGVIGQCRNLWFTSSGTFTVTFNSFKFSMSISSLLRLQQESGKTNRLLEEIQTQFSDYFNREIDPSAPGWADEYNDVSGKEDQVIDQLDPDQVIGDLGVMHSSVIDQILLHANAFQCIANMFSAFLKVPILSVLVYLSLLLGLLASMLGIGLAVGRAFSRHESKAGGK